MRTTVLSLLALGFVVTTSCSDDGEGPGTDVGVDLIAGADATPDTKAPDAGSPDVASEDGPTGTTISISVIAVDETYAALDGVKACVLDHPSIPCAFSNSTGLLTVINIPNDVDVMIALSKTGYVQTALPHEKGNVPTGKFQISMPSVAAHKKTMTDLGLTPGTSVGGINVSVLTNAGGLADATVKLDPVGGDGPYYTNSSGDFDKTLTATTSDGFVEIFNVPPGEYKLTVTKSNATCTIFKWLGWSGTSSTARVKTIADMVTAVAVTCN